MLRHKKSKTEEVIGSGYLDLVDKDGNNVFTVDSESFPDAFHRPGSSDVVVIEEDDTEPEADAEVLDSDSDVHDLKGDYSKTPLKTATNLMKLPILLSRSFKDVRHYQIHQKVKGEDQIYGVHIVPNPIYGAPTIKDALVLKFCMSAFRGDTAKSKIKKKSENPLAAPTFRFLARQYLDFIKQKKIGGTQLKSLRNALNRLQTTKIYLYTIDPTKSNSVEPEKQLHSSFVTEFLEEKVEVILTKTGYIVVDENVKKELQKVLPAEVLGKIKATQFTVKFGSWMKDFFMDDKAILTLNKAGYFDLDPIEMKFYELFRVFLGTKPYFKIKLRNIASRLGYILKSDEYLKGRRLNYVRTEIYHIIADNTLLGFSVAIEPPRPNGVELVCIYNSNWRMHISEEVDAVTKSQKLHPDTGKPLTVLEADLLNKDGPKGLRWFNGLIHFSDMRRKLMNDNDKDWIAHHKNDMDILRRGDIDAEKLTDKEKTRYRLLDLCRILETDIRSYQQKEKKQQVAPSAQS